MNTIKQIIDKAKTESVGDYFWLFKEIEKMDKDAMKKVKIALLSSFTTKGIKEVLTVECLKNGIFPEVYLGGYNNYAQEILNEDSSLYNFNPDLVIIFVDIQALFMDAYFLMPGFSEEKRKELISEQFKKMKSLIETLSERTSAKILLHNFAVPTYSPLGILENKQNFGFIESIKWLNKRLEELSEKLKVFIFDYELFCSKIGKNNLFDSRMYYLADMKIDLKYLPDLVDEYLAYIKPLLFLTRKCLVLDLDNTLWGGIVGEDGFENIKLGPTPEGRSFLEFQYYISGLSDSGVILAINSNNNLEDAMRVINEHPDMFLKEKRFASIKINWNDKVSNMKEIARELNIGLDSMVFIDDNQANREIIKQALPEVLVVDLPNDSAFYVKTLIEINDFNTLEITEEDKKRGETYSTQRQREEFKKKATNITEYLKNLETVVKIEKINDFIIPRIAQLTQKTNQFNATTRRYFVDDINNFLKSGRYSIIATNVKDKFGDNGTTGLVIIEKLPESWRIDTFLLSCRVIGRAIEKIMLAHIIEKAKGAGTKKLVGEFIATAKNTPAKDFYRDNGFKLTEEKEGFQKWEFNLENSEPQYPEFIKIIEN
ncbi:MAG: HAD-IIIC family phosphatase [Candidatus Staskawiczbacteria bacterium]|jgi:FkbH-like protein